MHPAAATGQFILFSAAAAAVVVFQKNRSVSWSLALFIGGTAAVAAFVGGYFSYLFSGFSLKLVFAAMLVVSGAVMLVPVSEDRSQIRRRGWLTVSLTVGDAPVRIRLLLAVPVTLMTGFAAGMVGVSGGSFLVPLMVLGCAVPMRVAVGTASILVVSTALTGFAGHAIHGDFRPEIALPLALVTIVGGLLGGRFAMKSKLKHLKRLFAITNWVAAVFMAISAFHGSPGS